MESRPRSFSQARISFEKDVPGWGKIQPKGGGPSFSFGCERKEEKESDSASGTLGTPNKGRSMERGEGQTPFPRGAYLPRKNDASRRPFAGGLPPYGILASFGARRFPKGERKALWCVRRRILLRRVGIDAPTTAREEGLQPYGAFTLFFRWRKKSVQKKASGTATPGKRLLLPILAAGLVMSRAA